MALARISDRTLGLGPANLSAAPLTGATPGGSSRSSGRDPGDIESLLQQLIPLLRQLSALLGTGNTPAQQQPMGQQQPARVDSKARTADAAGNPVARGWLDVYDDRLGRMQNAQDPALKAHYQAELAVIQKTLDSMGVPPPGGDDSAGPSGQSPAQADAAVGDRLGKLPVALANFAPVYAAAADTTGVPANVLAAMNWQESRGDTRAPGGGLGQMTNERFADLQTRHPQLAGKQLSEPGTNILATAFFMQDLLRQFGGNMKLALRAYNSGENGVDPNDPNATPAGTGDPTYVTKVMSMASTIDSGGDLPP